MENTTDRQAFLIWLAIQIFFVDSGTTERIAGVKPFRLSIDVIRIFSTPLVFKSVRIPIQKAADSFFPSQNPELPFHVAAKANGDVNDFIYYCLVFSYFEADAINPDDAINLLQRSVLPLGNVLWNTLGNSGYSWSGQF